VREADRGSRSRGVMHHPVGAIEKLRFGVSFVSPAAFWHSSTVGETTILAQKAPGRMAHQIVPSRSPPAGAWWRPGAAIRSGRPRLAFPRGPWGPGASSRGIAAKNKIADGVAGLGSAPRRQRVILRVCGHQAIPKHTYTAVHAADLIHLTRIICPRSPQLAAYRPKKKAEKFSDLRHVPTYPFTIQTQ
jgi:hypothetical protein